LPSFRKWVLIGDHRQLPAVVAQSAAQTSLAGDAMSEIALEDPRDSYFERMYALCKQKKWDWAYGSLIEQGRMHAEIMAFPSKVFYDNQLQLLETKRHQERDYLGPIRTINPPSQNQLSQTLASKRLIWIPSTSEPLLQFGKTHDQEAALTVDVVKELMHLYDGVPQIGIITPFRAQIANIRACLQKNNIHLPGLTVDTVERYQGSARDIIILSLSIHHPSMLQRIVSLSRDGVDRKLNVALTRARNQFILIACEQVVKYNRMYDELCRTCYALKPSAVTNTVARQEEMLQ
jgi:DNA replication ATP-dependent helicase Dna2